MQSSRESQDWLNFISNYKKPKGQGLDMLEMTLAALQDITLEKILDDHGRKNLWSEFPQIMRRGFTCIQSSICLSSMGRPISYERAVAWKVLNEDDYAHCICFMFVNWSFVWLKG
ncbi:unnamed protein product [Fraxinus pennsylvanica]|uniref:MEKHLA domain-containing protein n=1 Tax=Fraxinus pennsylvanica TaxID=56036 RepID=A0AAD2E3H8_9LAMI|nr:unnamed protein product [Fraxinus pennsylvanica]